VLKLFSKILSDVLTALYQPFWFAIVISVLTLFLYRMHSVSGTRNWE